MTATPLSLDDPASFVDAVTRPGTYTFDCGELGSDGRAFADNLLKSSRRAAQAHGNRITRVTRAGRTYWFEVVAA